MAKKLNTVNPLGQKQIYYPALDGLRFFAFLLVFLHHAFFAFSSSNPILNNILIAIKKNGWLGVDLFFVISGFLITTILIRERKEKGRYSLKNFWIRRSLRIWPLYYLGLIMGFWIIPFLFVKFFGANFSGPAFEYQINHNPPFYALFLGNWIISSQGYGVFYHTSHLWTISLEEQFYFGWPIVLLFIKNFKQTLIVGIYVIIFSLIVRLYLGLNNTFHPGIYTNTFARIDILTMGAILALIYHYKSNLITKIKPFLKPKFQILVLLTLFFLMYRISVFDSSILRNVVFGYLFFGLVMVYFTLSALNAGSPTANFLRWRPFVFLGKISYGLYIWHILALDLALHIANSINLYFIHPLIGLIMTIIFGIISYYCFEIIFLKLKSKFTIVKSRPI